MSDGLPPSSQQTNRFIPGSLQHQLGLFAPYLPAPLPPSCTSPITAATSAVSRIKLKRSRQRVDAGEPRNSYQSVTIPSASKQMIQHPRFPSSPSAAVPSAPYPSFNFGPDGLNNLLPHLQNANAWYRLQQQQQQNGHGANEQENGVTDPEEKEETKDVANSTSNDEENGNKSTETDPCKVCDDSAADIEQDTEEVKKDCDETSDMTERSPRPEDQSPKSKRKSFQPKQVDPTANQDDSHLDDTNCDDVMDDAGELGDKSPSVAEIDERTTNAVSQDSQNGKLQEVLSVQRQLYFDWMEQQKKLMAGNIGPPTTTIQSQLQNAAARSTNSFFEAEKLSRPATNSVAATSQRELKNLAQTLKQELTSTLSSTIDRALSDFAQTEAARIAAIQKQQQLEAAAAAAAQHQQQQASSQHRPFYLHPFYHPYTNPSVNFAQTAGIFPIGFSSPWSTAAAASAGLNRPPMGAKDDFATLLPTRKKRSKVTDTRLSKMPFRTGSATPSRSSPVPASTNYFPPTMVGHPLYGTPTFGSEDRQDSPGNSDDMSENATYDGIMPQSSTLTPMHLRKAKLMFFYTRYPSSALLKSYFPDIRFNKNNTAQLVKWFSNFREFFYIQMEKYARQALAEGFKLPEQLSVSLDSEIYKQLNQHYNRNNHIQPPEKLRQVIEDTLREFFLAIQASKDNDPSWKKQIYKVIARMDDTIPEYFKDPNFLERLE